MGLSGKMRIQILPPRFTWRVMAIRAASICREVIHPGWVVIRPNSPKARFEPRYAFPGIRPFCILRYLVRAG